jgi:hypothetical protein
LPGSFTYWEKINGKRCNCGGVSAVFLINLKTERINMHALKEILIPMFAITALFIIPGLIGLTAVILWFKSRNRLYQSIDVAIEKNAPPEVISQLVAMSESNVKKEDKTSRQKHISDGAVILAVGIAFLVIYFLGISPWVIWPGLFLTLIGLAKLCIGIFADKDDSTDSE